MLLSYPRNGTPPSVSPRTVASQLALKIAARKSQVLASNQIGVWFRKCLAFRNHNVEKLTSQLAQHCSGCSVKRISMASLVSCVGRAASNGLVSRTLCDFQIPKAESVSLSKTVRRQQIGLEQDCFVPAFHRRAARFSTVSRKAGAPGDGDEPTKRDSESSETKFDDTVDGIQKALGKSFGGPLWFAVLLTLLAIFGGGYVYLIYNYADFTDIPILNGAQGL